MGALPSVLLLPGRGPWAGGAGGGKQSGQSAARRAGRIHAG